MRTEPIVVLDKVSYLYPRSKKPALCDISLEIQKGEFLGLIGPTGAGKTTLCLTFNGIVPQFYGGRFFGRAIVAGLDTLEHPISTLARHVGAVFQDPETQLIATSVENEIAFALENLCVPRDEIKERIPRVLAAVRLEGTEHKHPHELSGGQKQRLAIAAALAMQPDLMVLDEPTSQLDPIGAEEVFTIVRELNKELGMTIVMASHAAEEMAEYADRIALLFDGRIIAIGSPDEIYSQVDALYEHYLRPPQVSETFYMIGKRGAPVNRPPVRMSEGIILLDTLRKQCAIAAPKSLSAPLP
ncbi:MAG: energy-coupling factor ABC transporter ATP-binding protein, partial [Anaerolineae bacterium]